MFYRLHEDVSYCQVDDHLVFLDIRKDQYFRLSSQMERSFIAHINGREDSGISIGALIEHGILVATLEPDLRGLPFPAAPPVRSAVEQPPERTHPSIGTLIEVFYLVYSTRLHLATRRLNIVLTKLIADRRNLAPPPCKSLTELDEEVLLEAAALFRQVRRYVPIEPRCLLDSLALAKFLIRRHQYTKVIFGVTGDPFAAHAWVQAADLVLSDTVGSAAAHTPIRVI